MHWEIWKQPQQQEQAKCKDALKWKDPGSLVQQGLTINASYFRIHHFPPGSEGTPPGSTLGSIFFPPEPLGMEIHSKIFQYLWSREFVFPKWWLHHWLYLSSLGGPDQYLGEESCNSEKRKLANSTKLFSLMVVLVHSDSVFSDKICDLFP